MNTSKTLKTISLFLLVLLFSCKTSFYTKKISRIESDDSGIIYTLPKTKLIITAKLRMKSAGKEYLRTIRIFILIQKMLF